MKHLSLNTMAALALLVGGERAAQATDYFVSPTGQASGDGSKAKPLSLAATLSGALAKPGDTFWLMGGNYSLGYVGSTLQGAAGKPVAVRAIPGQRVTVDGAVTLFSTVGYVDFWGLEWKRSNPSRISAQTGFNPTDIDKRNGFNTFAPHVRLINLVIHDQVGAGVYLSAQSVGAEVHGCLSYNNGYVTQNIRDGHAYYAKNNGEAKILSDNFAFNGIASGFHIFTEGVDTMNNITLDGNVAFNAGVYAPAGASGGYRDLLCGGDGQVTVENIAINNSFLYYKPGSAATVIGMAQIGRDGVNRRLTLVGNHFTAGMMLKNWSGGTVADNLIGASGTLVDDYQNLVGMSGLSWNGNAYRSLNSSATPFRLTQSSSSFLSLAAWRSATGFDASSSLASGGYGGVDVYLRPNKYEPGRANLIVYNWAKQATVPVRVSSVLPRGTSYEVRNVQDFYAPPVLTGIYTGEDLVLPMTGLTVAKPIGPFTAAAPIGPEFNAFVLIPLPSGSPDAMAAVSGVASVISAATLLNNDGRLRSPLTLTAVSPVSAKGGTVSLSSDQVTYKSASGFSGTDTFTYTVVDNLGSVGTGLVTVTVSSGSAPSGYIGLSRFGNSTAMTIPSKGTASVYPSSVTVSGMGGQVSKVTVKLVGVTHPAVSDVAAVLVSPDGRAVELFSLIGIHGICDGLTWVFDDAATAYIPVSYWGNLASGTYKPSLNDGVALLPAPAPTSGIKTNLSAFMGASPNGVWSLYVADLYANNAGALASGWILDVTTATAGGTASSPAQRVSFQSAPASTLAGAGSGTLYTPPQLAANADRSFDLRIAAGSSLEVSSNGLTWLPVATGGASVWNDVAANSATSRLYRVSAPGQSPVTGGFVRQSVPASGFAVISSPFGDLDGAEVFAEVPDGTQVFVFDASTAAFTAYTRARNQWLSAAGGVPVVPWGTACFIKNPTSAPFKVVVSGSAPVTAKPLVYPPGYHLVANVAPRAGLLEHQLGLTVVPGDRVHLYQDGTYLTYRRATGRWLPREPALALGQGFFFENHTPSSWLSAAAE